MRRKKSLPTAAIFLGLCFLLIANSFGQTTYTGASGYVRHDLFVGFNPVGLNLHKPKIANGTITDESGTTITDAAATFTTSLPNPTTVTYLIEILDGTQAGAVAEIASITDDTNIEVDGAITAGIGAAYCIRPAATMNETFGVDTAAQLQGSFDSADADVVWVPDGFGNYNKYFYSTVGLEFRDAALPFASPAKPVIWFYPDGAFIQVRTTPKTLTIFGDVKTTPTIVAGLNGFNLVSTPSPVGETLDESNLEAWLNGSFDSADADVLWLPDGAGGYVTYFWSSGQNEWKLASQPFGPGQGTVNMPSSVLIQRKGTDTAGLFDLPMFFSTL